ncbi:jg1856 [Pararge aegeria aegeria]|uniref:Jg1856 protein n=1 Tax=Pararge aegeria aegeria TaxID=348720 RepID=A0A8S4R4L0_9NEOP|nr:jg1856 [Pararge aegeria aegeria]
MMFGIYKVAAIIFLAALSKGELPEDDFRIINRQGNYFTLKKHLDQSRYYNCRIRSLAQGISINFCDIGKNLDAELDQVTFCRICKPLFTNEAPRNILH